LQPEQQPTNINIKQPRPPKINTPIILVPFNSRKKGDRLTLEVKKAGKFRPADFGENIDTLSERGQDILKNTARAQYRIKGAKGETLDIPTPKGFQKSKSVKGGIVQPRSQRISTRGELQEITYEGIRTKARRGKNKFKL